MEAYDLTLKTESAPETQAVGEQLGLLLQSGDLLALAGDLGAGKTVFAQGLARGLGIRAVVNSPTFVLINQYQAPDGRVLHHADCYRLANAPLEMWDVGLADLLQASDDIVVIEWADRIPELLPKECLEITLIYLTENRRRLCFRAHGARHVALLEQLALLYPSTRLPLTESTST